MKTKSILASLAAASFVVAQPAAAATRSYESVPAAGVTVAADRAGAAVGAEDALRGKSPVLPIVLIAVVLGLLLALSGGGSDNAGKSPG